VAITVRTLQGKVLALDVQPSTTTVDGLEALVGSQLGLSTDGMHLVYQGKRLTHNQSLYSCGLAQGSTVYLVSRMRC
jgi:hypothetical protein